MPRRRGSRLTLLVIGLIALVAIALYALREPLGLQVRRQFDQVADAVRGKPTPAERPQPDRVAMLDAEIEQLRGRVATLEQRVVDQAKAAPPSARPVLQQLPAAPDLAPNAGGGEAMVVALSARMDALAARQDHLDAEQTTDAKRLEAAANQAAAVSAVSDRTARLARLQAATAALASGAPLGDVPGTSAALARFRSDPPPTEASLRLAFPEIAAKARAVTRVAADGSGFWRAMQVRAQSLITVRRGNRVLLGSAQDGVIDRAQVMLDAGDLAGALAILGQLDGPAAAAVAAWRIQAQALLDARAALVRLFAES